MKPAPIKPIVTMTEPQPCRCKMDIEISAQDVSQALKRTTSMVLREARLPGFRPGKAPAALVKQKYADTIQDEARRFLLNAAIEAACGENNVRPESDPVLEGGSTVNDLTLADGAALAFSVSFDVAPTFEIPDYKTMTVEREEVSVDETAIQEVVRNMLQSRISYETVERPAKKGDLLRVSYTAILAEEGIEIPASAKFVLEANSTWMPLSDPEFIPGTVEPLIGAEVGGKVTVDVTFPETFFEKSLVGKKATYTISVEEIQSVNIPELTDDLAKEMGADTAEAMRSNIQGYLENQENYRADMTFRENIAKTILSGMDFPLPPETLETAVRDEAQRLFEAEFRRAQGNHQAVTDKKDELMAMAKNNAESALRRRYVFLKIADAEGIKVDREDVDAVIESLAQRSGISSKAMAKRISRSGRLNDLFLNIRESKTIDFVATQMEKKA